MNEENIAMLEFVYNRLVEHGENPNTDYLKKLHKFIQGRELDFISDRYVVVTENDMGNDRWMDSHGPMAMETNLSHADCQGVIKRAESIGDRYGRQMICRLDPIGNLAEFKRLVD